MCGCKKNNQNLVNSMTQSALRSTESTVESKFNSENSLMLQFVGAGANIAFYGVSGARYYFTSGMVAYVLKEDTAQFLKFRQGGKFLFKEVKEENINQALESGDIMQEMAIAEELPKTVIIDAPLPEPEVVPEIVFEAQAVEELKPRRSKKKATEDASEL